MSFIASAILIAKICTNEGECHNVEVARFGNGEAGQDFCNGTAGAINSVEDEIGSSHYFCVSPQRAKLLLSVKGVRL